MVVSIREVRWPDDEHALRALDRSFETDRVYRVSREGTSFIIDEIDVAPPYRRVEAPLDFDEMRTFDAVFVAERDDVVAGYGALQCHRWNRRGVVGGLYVDRAHRGVGVGRALVDALDRAARDAGMNRLWAETQDMNVPAVRFYLAAGFSLCGVDTSLYDPASPAGDEVALYLTRPLA